MPTDHRQSSDRRDPARRRVRGRERRRSHARQWRRCDRPGDVLWHHRCQGQGYSPQLTDQGTTLRVRVCCDEGAGGTSTRYQLRSARDGRRREHTAEAGHQLTRGVRGRRGTISFSGGATGRGTERADSPVVEHHPRPLHHVGLPPTSTGHAERAGRDDCRTRSPGAVLHRIHADRDGRSGRDGERDPSHRSGHGVGRNRIRPRGSGGRTRVRTEPAHAVQPVLGGQLAGPAERAADPDGGWHPTRSASWSDGRGNAHDPYPTTAYRRAAAAYRSLRGVRRTRRWRMHRRCIGGWGTRVGRRPTRRGRLSRGRIWAGSRRHPSVRCAVTGTRRCPSTDRTTR